MSKNKSLLRTKDCKKHAIKNMSLLIYTMTCAIYILFVLINMVS